MSSVVIDFSSNLIVLIRQLSIALIQSTIEGSTAPAVAALSMNSNEIVSKAASKPKEAHRAIAISTSTSYLNNQIMQGGDCRFAHLRHVVVDTALMF